MGRPGETFEPLAITGIGCRFPGGATGPEEFWRLLRNGVDAVREVPADRWDIGAFYGPDPAGEARMVTRWGGFVDQGIDELDALFFGISPREAAYLDPMQRWLLEVVWEALEDGGEVPEERAGSDTGVFVGVFTRDMEMLQLSPLNRTMVDGYSATGSAMTMAANRISYQFDFRGPSLAIDTACSSSLVAVHYACRSLWDGECGVAVAGGASVMIRPEYAIAESKAGMLSPDGRCKAFDAGANGYVRGEGAGVVVIKPLRSAVADGNPVYALILGTAVNQDGKTNGITVPSIDAQVEVVREACRRAGVSPGQIRYVEAHGTGTPVGDPAEAKALARVLATDRPAGDRCPIGSVKTNIGHLEAAAGIAGLIKAALCLKHREIPPHLHLRAPNPQIPFDKLCIRIPRTVEPLRQERLYAGVNSFGFGGTNAHVVLAEAPRLAPDAATEEAVPGDAVHLVPLSARSPEALRALAGEYGRLCSPEGDGVAPRLADLAYSAGARRSHHPHRLALVVGSHGELSESVDLLLSGEPGRGVHTGYTTPGRQPRIVFVFSGMGPQWWAMGRQLLAAEPVFRDAIVRCDELLGTHAGWSLMEEMTAPESDSRIAETRVAQPANFALQVALLELWRYWGVEPDAVVGHSAGEVAALYAAGVYGLEEAVRLIYHRSRLQHRTSGQGRMVAIGLPLEELRASLAGYDGRVSVAAVNGPSAVTLVGDEAALQAIVAPLEERKVFCRYLRTEVPYHSHYMDPLRGELLESLSFLEPAPPAIPWISSVTGGSLDHGELTASYWWRNVREPVLFAPATEALVEAGYGVFLELSPHPVLSGTIGECLERMERKGKVVPCLRRGENERATMLAAAGALYASGGRLAWGAVEPPGRFVPLPRYPWQRERYWAESQASQDDRFGLSAVSGNGHATAAGSGASAGATRHPLLGRRLRSAHPTWEVRIDRHSTVYLEDHQIEGAVVFPGAALLEMGVAATAELVGEYGAGFELADVELHKALFLPADTVATLQVVIDPQSQRLEICSPAGESGDRWTRHTSGRILPGEGLRRGPVLDLDEIRRACPEELSGTDCYARFAAMGFQYGATFRSLRRLWIGSGEAVAVAEVHPAVEAELDAYHVHPAILDAGFQTLLASTFGLAGEAGGAAAVYLPVGGEGFRVYARPSARTWIHARLLEVSPGLLRGDIRLLDEGGRVVLAVQGLRAVPLEGRALAAGLRLEDLFYTVEWVPKEPPKAPLSAPGEATGAGSWLLLADAGGVARELKCLLEARGDVCSLVRPEGTCGPPGVEAGSGVSPSDGEGLLRLLRKADGRGEARFQGIVHLWSLDLPSSDGVTADRLEKAQELTCVAVANVVQALGEGGWKSRPRLWLVTRGAQATGVETGPVEVAQAPLWGLGVTLAHQEHRDVWGRLVDLDPGAPPTAAAAALLSELTDGDRALDQVVLRGAKRYVPRLARSRDLAGGLLAPRFRDCAAYLITGGFGGLGLEVARWMVGHGARHLILLGRHALPERSCWDTATRPEERRRIAAVRELEALGATVETGALDVGSEAELAGFLGGYRKRCSRPIRGVLHLAGVSQPRLLLRMHASELRATLRPKLTGGWLLHSLLADEPLDFFILFSSIAGLGFSMGQSAYAAGNASLDALAHYRQSRGLPALSIGWGAWADVGMGSHAEVAASFERRGMTPIEPKQALQALARLFGRSLPQVVVTACDWPVVAENNYPLGMAPPLLQDLLGEGNGAGGPDSAAETESPLHDRILVDLQEAEHGRRLPLLTEHLHHLTARVLRLGRSQLDLEQPLNTLGLDSMVAMELKNRVEADLGVSVSVVDLLQGASISQLAEKLLEDLDSQEAARDSATEPDLSVEAMRRLVTEVSERRTPSPVGVKPQ